jgi:hypothetical protein
MLTKILIGLAAVVVVLCVIVAAQPADFRVERSAIISAPPALVFAQVNDFHKWEVWSPWAKLDPNAKNTFEGPPAGTGAGFGWSGNKDVGEGRMLITESRPNELIRIKLDFIRPFKSTNTTEYTFKTEDKDTRITWAMFGKNNFMGKAFGLFVDCDKMIGADFEKGLASIKTISESAAK